MERRVVSGAPFHHVVYRKGGDARADTLHVYIEGDGRPWLYGVLVATDPTPRTPYALTLMAQDPGPALYLGRPCYFGLHRNDGCDPRYWTSARYSPEVVDSMVAALARLLAEAPSRDIVLIGYSGGGALATLMAHRLPRVHHVVTVAGNLDTEQWAIAHGYLPLSDSLNPMEAAQIAAIPHIHYSGTDDTNVPPALVRAFAQRHNGRYRPIDGFDHRCCWHENWRGLLQEAGSLADNSSEAVMKD